MKKRVVAITTFVFICCIVAFIACKKDSSSTQGSNQNQLQTLSEFQQVDAKIGVRLRWRGLIGTTGCNGSRKCGDCIGLCIFFGFTEPQQLTEEEKQDGGTHANIKLTSPSTLEFYPDGIFDNGDGTVNITDDFYIDATVANKLNCNSIKVLKGIYNIDYSASTYGMAIFNVVTQ